MKPRFITNARRRAIVREVAVEADLEAFRLEVEVERRRAVLAAKIEGASEAWLASGVMQVEAARAEAARLAELADLDVAATTAARRAWLAGTDDNPEGGWIAHTEAEWIAAQARRRDVDARLWEISHAVGMDALARLEQRDARKAPPRRSRQQAKKQLDATRARVR